MRVFAITTALMVAMFAQGGWPLNVSPKPRQPVLRAAVLLKIKMQKMPVGPILKSIRNRSLNFGIVSAKTAAW